MMLVRSSGVADISAAWLSACACMFSHQSLYPISRAAKSPVADRVELPISLFPSVPLGDFRSARAPGRRALQRPRARPPHIARSFAELQVHYDFHHPSSSYPKVEAVPDCRCLPPHRSQSIGWASFSRWLAWRMALEPLFVGKFLKTYSQMRCQGRDCRNVLSLYGPRLR